MMTDFEVALRVAAIAHSGQRYGDDLFFETHVLDVIARVQRETDDVRAHIVAALHDVVEDTPLTLDNLAYFGTRVQRAVDAISRRPGESYLDYIDRVSRDDLAALVKRCDLAANIAHGGPRVRRYSHALALLGGPIPCDLDFDADDFVNARS